MEWIKIDYIVPTSTQWRDQGSGMKVWGERKGRGERNGTYLRKCY